MLNILLAISIALSFTLINTLINHLKTNNKNVLALATELFLYILAIQSCLYFFNADMIFEVFFLIVFYIEARVFGGVTEVLNNRKDD